MLGKLWRTLGELLHAWNALLSFVAESSVLFAWEALHVFEALESCSMPGKHSSTCRGEQLCFKWKAVSVM
jgi:hypothetical protein